MSMKKMFLVFMALAVLAAALPAAQASAETITWPGSWSLRTDPAWSVLQSLFPDELSDNSVTVNGDVPGAVFGGVTVGPGDVTGNSVTVNGGTIGNSVLGGLAGAGDATGNSVTVNSGKVTGYVWGGVSDNGGATGNSVTINGGEVAGNVSGGATYSGGICDTTYNTVTISGSPVFGATTILEGGGYGADDFTGNTLNVENYSGSAVFEVYWFEFFNFTFPSTQSGPVLTVTDFANLGNFLASKGSTVTAGTSGGVPLAVGKSVTLIEAGTLNLNGFTQTQAGGAGYLWDLEVIPGVDGTLSATVAKTLWVDLQNATITGGAFTAGKAGSLTFAVSTAGIPDGSPITLNNINSVPGISIETKATTTTGINAAVSISEAVTTGNSTIVTISTTAATPAGTHPLTLTIDGVTSAEFYLTVNEPEPRGSGGCLNTGAGMVGMLALALLAALRKGKKTAR